MHTLKKILPIYALALLLAAVLLVMKARAASASEVATSKKLDIGGMLGAPTGLSLKRHTSPKHALDFGVGRFVDGAVGVRTYF